MADTSNTARLRCSGQEYAVSFDLDRMTGEVLETLEERLGGVGIYAWLRRWTDALGQGVRLSEFRTRDIIGLVYLGAAQAEPGTTWEQVSRSIAPYTIEFIADEPAEKRTVEAPAGPALEPSLSGGDDHAARVEAARAAFFARSAPAPARAVDAAGHRDVPPAFVQPGPPQVSPVATALGHPEAQPAADHATATDSVQVIRTS